MPKVLVIYYSRSGHTESLAKAIAQAIVKEGIDVDCKNVEDANPDELLDTDGVVLGSPTYYGTMAAEMKKFIDDSVKHHGKLDGKIGAAFATAGAMGQETTVLSLLEALLIHGMIVQGDFRGSHYGITSLGKPGKQDIQRCQRFGQRFASLVKQIKAK
jgi:NAD(P)H dehydrogenase (quinone)